ncbi:MAG TPA: hypothetical protein VNX02_00775 [Steroidobacteraceae bacterium]|jgi:hypothetical protein|nr:hypothetical protein [Steroidobacteraceae bacterium]
MNRIVIAIACATMSGVGGIALAQAPPPDTQPPPPTAPPSDYQSAPTPSAGSSSTTSSDSKHALMKQCMAQQEQNQANSGMSKKDMKKYCKSQVKNSAQNQ